LIRAVILRPFSRWLAHSPISHFT